MIQLQDDGKIKAPSGNILDLGRGPNDPVAINGTSIVLPSSIVLGLTGTALPVGASPGTNTTISIAGTAGTATGSVLMRDTAVNGGIGTVVYTFQDLVHALKAGNIIAQ